ncbi:MAG: SufS family cysteine desulfurase [Deltaproteobacteria bacterium]|nr:SufS family cysteine desulfurase [Deltaproteobacteria bacterium]
MAARSDFSHADVLADFPLLDAQDPSAPLHYLDNAATTHKPRQVLDAIMQCYTRAYAPVHRGLYGLAAVATNSYESARQRLAGFIGASSPGEVLFTHSATESINLVAQGWARHRLAPGDQVWVSRMEHHSNFLPWQRTCAETGAKLRVIELNPDGTLDMCSAPELFGTRTRLIALTHVSNTLGVVNPVQEVAERASNRRIAVLVDAAQSAAHEELDVEELDCDFLAFSGHKMYGPGGIGLLYAKAGRLAEMEPVILGGGMVDEVGEVESSWAPAPARFEAGSPNLADAIGFAAAAEYVAKIGNSAIRAHVRNLADYALQALRNIPGIEIYGPPAYGQRAGIISFNLEGVHPHDVAQIAAEMGVALRAGHHCCQPLMKALGIAGTVRASFAIYNNASDIEALVSAVSRAGRLLR